MASVYNFISTMISNICPEALYFSTPIDQSPSSLRGILDKAAEQHGFNKIITYPHIDTKLAGNSRKLSYKDLRIQAKSNATRLKHELISKSCLVLLHFDNHLDNIIWFWSVVFANCTPVMSTPFIHDDGQRQKHIQHLHTIFEDPLCLTNSTTLGDFEGQNMIKPIIVEKLLAINSVKKSHYNISNEPAASPAVLMLTSGSSGNAKAVCLRHDQIVAAIKGKASVIKLNTQHAFLNWVGLDHVAGLIEIHLQAMYLGMDQVHVNASTVLAEPALFLNLVNEYRVSRSFAPNFFLAKLRQCIEADDPKINNELDLSCLLYLASGGESNNTETCRAVADLLHHKYRAPENVIIPGFGMTETCAGAIFNLHCPSYDIQHGLEFASLGQCMPGIQMRITQTSEARSPGMVESGDLEVTGPVVFREYYNNHTATEDAFTSDGWFKTGDQGLIDSSGYLRLTGRTKEVININGVKILPHELENAIDEASIGGVTSSYTVCFSHRLKDSATERIHVLYLPSYPPDDSKSRSDTLDSIVSVVMLQTRTRPYVLPLDRQSLPKTTLGKISRTKIKAAFQRGEFAMQQSLNDDSIMSYRTQQKHTHVDPLSETEKLLIIEVCETLGYSAEDIVPDDSIFSMGITSVDLIRLQRNVQINITPAPELTMSSFLTNPTIRSLAHEIDKTNQPKDYDPVVKLRHQGHKTPLWLVHPGVGEVLVFINLANHLTDRPVYALRARGFNAGQTPFESIHECITAYHTAIKKTQPDGPYAIAGYSYGTMLAFETAKILESNGDSVRFLGSFNLPPHIKDRMNQLVWSECLLHLSYFLDIISETAAAELSVPLQPLSKEEALATVMKFANPARTAELSLNSPALHNWTNIAFALQSMARAYEPSGSVACMDVFYATPLAVVAQSKQEWVEGPLSQWRDFVRQEPRFHEVHGAHYTMISTEHVQGFARALKGALRARGV